jgi:hypothetical protein
VVEVGTVEKILSGCCGNGIGQLKVRGFTSARNRFSLVLVF